MADIAGSEARTPELVDPTLAVSAPAPTTRNDQPTWQDRLLPLMVRMLVGLTIFFLLASLVQLFYLNWRIQLAPAIPASNLVRPLVCPAPFSPEMCVAAERVNTAAILEANIVERRYHQAGILLMGRVWYTYLGFLTGMILALVGATFILGQLRISDTEVEAKTVPIQITLKSASPGLILCVLGAALMTITFVNPQDIKINDTSVYFGNVNIPSESYEKPQLGQLLPKQDPRK